MSSNRFIHALYDDDDTLLKAVKNIRSENYDIEGGLYTFSCSWAR